MRLDFLENLIYNQNIKKLKSMLSNKNNVNKKSCSFWVRPDRIGPDGGCLFYDSMDEHDFLFG